MTFTCYNTPGNTVFLTATANMSCRILADIRLGLDIHGYPRKPVVKTNDNKSRERSERNNDHFWKKIKGGRGEIWIDNNHDIIAKWQLIYQGAVKFSHLSRPRQSNEKFWYWKQAKRRRHFHDQYVDSCWKTDENLQANLFMAIAPINRYYLVTMRLITGTMLFLRWASTFQISRFARSYFCLQ